MEEKKTAWKSKRWIDWRVVKKDKLIDDVAKCILLFIIGSGLSVIFLKLGR